MVYKCQHGLCPSYLAEDCILLSATRGRQHPAIGWKIGTACSKKTCNDIHKIKTRQQIKFRCSKPADNAQCLHYIQNNFFFDISEQTLETTETQALSELYNLSLARSEVPWQWKRSIITPVPKVAKPKACAEYRPISVTPISVQIPE